MADILAACITSITVPVITNPSNYGSLTTEFTYQPFCLTRWSLLYPEASGYVDVVFNAWGNYSVETEFQNCQPHRATTAAFSPGICASGYRVVTITETRLLSEPSNPNSRLWQALCCRGSFTLSSEDCFSLFSSTSITAFRREIAIWTEFEIDSPTTRTYTQTSTIYVENKNATLMSRGTMLEKPWTVWWRASDLTAFPASYASTIAARLSIPFTPTASPGGTASRPAGPTSTIASNTPEPSAPSSGLGTGAKAGIGVGAAVGALLLLSVLILLLRRRKSKPSVKPSSSQEGMADVHCPELVSVNRMPAS